VASRYTNCVPHNSRLIFIDLFLSDPASLKSHLTSPLEKILWPYCVWNCQSARGIVFNNTVLDRRRVCYV